MHPLAIDLFCGLGGWTEGLLSEGFDVVGFDIEVRPYPGHLVIQDARTLHGSQFRNAAVIVASPPCQDYSYRAMPWTRAKALPPPDNELFDTCFRIQREANESSGRYIPLIVENVRGAEKWVGPARWHFGSFYLWGDVPALMPRAYGVVTGSTPSCGLLKETGGVSRHPTIENHQGPGESPQENDSKTPALYGVKQRLGGGNWWRTGGAAASSKSAQRKQFSAMIAKIPPPLSRHIARSFYPPQPVVVSPAGK